MSKLHAVIEMLEKMRSDDSTYKALVFGHSNASLKVLRPMLAQRGFGVRTLHGGMAAPQRASAIGAFQTDPHTTVFLLGVRAASTGINLTAANRIFFLDPLSNSSEETQCIGRAHRLGQTRDVLVSRLFLRDSIESFASHLNCMDLARTMFS
jgi:SNF2 family DNA or RNA helicase